MMTYLASRFNKEIVKPLLNISMHRALVNIESNKPADGIFNSSDLSTEEEKYVLERLNEAGIHELSRYNLAKHKAERLEYWRKRKGKFNNLNDVLEVEGLGVKSLYKLCRTILRGENENTDEVKDKRNHRSRANYISPLLSQFQIKDLTSAVGIHLYATGISWAKIKREENVLTEWDNNDFNLGNKKLTPADALQLVIQISNNIPSSDLYIFEAPIAATPTAQQSSISVAAYVQKVQLLSMLITLLSTSPKHNISYIEQQKLSEKNTDFNLTPKVHFLRHRLSARLFRTLIGTEKVSAATTVANILNNTSENLVYTPIQVDSEFQTMYGKQDPVTKEVLGQALMLTIAFLDICVYQSANSLRLITSNSR